MSLALHNTNITLTAKLDKDNTIKESLQIFKASQIMR